MFYLKIKDPSSKRIPVIVFNMISFQADSASDETAMEIDTNSGSSEETAASSQTGSGVSEEESSDADSGEQVTSTSNLVETEEK